VDDEIEQLPDLGLEDVFFGGWGIAHECVAWFERRAT
jgi:hypothetical protein